MDKGLLALNRCDELEEMLRKRLGGNSSSYLEKDNMQTIPFNDMVSTQSFSLATEGFDFGAGITTFIIEGHLSATVITNYKIKVFINEYLNREFNIELKTLEHDCKFLISPFMHTQRNFVKIEIIPETLESNTITATGFCIYTKIAKNIYPCFYEVDKLPYRDNKIKFSVYNGEDADGVTHQKYGYGVLGRDGTYYVGEGEKENFSFENSSLQMAITTYEDKGCDYAVNYLVTPKVGTDISEICYKSLVTYASDSGNTSDHTYRNVSLKTDVYTMLSLFNNITATPATHSSGKAYAKIATIGTKGLIFTYMSSNVVIGVKHYYNTSDFKGFNSAVMPIARNLNQTRCLFPCFLEANGKLYFFIENVVTVPTLVENITDNIEKVTHSVFGDDSGDEILVYYQSCGYLKCYHIKKEESGSYVGDYFETIGYGITEYLPLIDNDAVFVYGDKIFFTKEADKICQNT